jgi:hypothetical protein
MQTGRQADRRHRNYTHYTHVCMIAIMRAMLRVAHARIPVQPRTRVQARTCSHVLIARAHPRGRALVRACTRALSMQAHAYGHHAHADTGAETQRHARALLDSNDANARARGAHTRANYASRALCAVCTRSSIHRHETPRRQYGNRQTCKHANMQTCKYTKRWCI